MRLRYYDLFNKLIREDIIKCYRNNIEYYMIPKYYNIFTWPWGYIIKDTFMGFIFVRLLKRKYFWE